MTTALSAPTQPYRIADDTWVVGRPTRPAGSALALHRNSLVIRGQEPVLIDTGAACEAERWLADTWALVDPADVRWIVVTHDEPDHAGNLATALAASPRATLVATPATLRRLVPRLGPVTSRAVEADGRLDIGDRELLLLSPPVYDAPGTAAVLDGRTGTLWAADAFGIPVADHAEDARDLPRRDFEDGFAAYHRVLAPWLALADATRWDATVSALAALTPLAVVSAHGPALTGARLEAAFDLLRRLPDLARARAPDLDRELDALLAAIAA